MSNSRLSDLLAAVAVFGLATVVFGPVGSVVLGGIGTLLVAAPWVRLFPVLARRDRMV